MTSKTIIHSFLDHQKVDGSLMAPQIELYTQNKVGGISSQGSQESL